jgi:hypothetical protein
MACVAWGLDTQDKILRAQLFGKLLDIYKNISGSSLPARDSHFSNSPTFSIHLIFESFQINAIQKM